MSTLSKSADGRQRRPRVVYEKYQDYFEYREENFNAWRRKRYQNDPAYREKAREASRLNYRRTRGKELGTCLHNIENCATLATTQRVLLPNGTHMDWPVLDLRTTSALVGKLYQTVWRWIHTGMLPSPVLSLRRRDVPQQFYHVDEVRSFVRILGKHELEFAYYRRDHVNVRKALFAANRTVRTQLGML